MIVVETHKQHVRVGIIQSLGTGLTTTRVEMVVSPNINVVRRGVLIGFTTKLGSGLGGVLAIKNLSRNLTLLTITIGVIGIPQMVFTNLMITIHMNKTTNRPLMSSMVVGGYKSIDVVHLRRRYQELIVVIVPILDHKDGHCVKPNKVALKYPDFKKDVDPNVHVRMSILQ
jgi:hypothetical protein